jgi:hypothetical protein
MIVIGRFAEDKKQAICLYESGITELEKGVKIDIKYVL